MQLQIKAAMKPSSPSTLPSTCLVEIIELKWLLAGHGIHVHVERLQTDPEYARHMLDSADATPSSVLRSAATRLRGCLGLGG